MKKALVFGGGGSKGAYEVGVWKALNELGISFDIVCGTSIGALIGAMYVQDDFTLCESLWNSLDVSNVIKNGISIPYDLTFLITEKKELMEMFHNIILNKGIDISPFEHMIDKMFNYNKFFSSPIDYGCMCVLAEDMKPYPVVKKDLTDKNVKDFLLASSSCFPAFPMKEIDGKKYIDGGYFDNVPVSLALEMGADEVLAIDLKQFDRNKNHVLTESVSYIEPYISLGSFLDFSAKKINFNKMLGYYDTMKHYQKYCGYLYTFPNYEKEKIKQFNYQIEQYFTLKIQNLKYFSQLYELIFTHQLNKFIEDEYKVEYSYLRMIEKIAELFDIEIIKVYHFQDFLSEIKYAFHAYLKKHEDINFLLIPSLVKGTKHFSKKETVTLLYQFIVYYNSHDIEILKKLPITLNEEACYAFCLYYLCNTNIIINK